LYLLKKGVNKVQKEVFYNIAQQNITEGLKDFEISSSQDYFIMLEAPTNANIRVKLNSVTAHEIPIKENWQFSSKDVNKMYLSCDPVEGAIIKYGQADGNLEIKPNPTINKIDLITNIGNFESPLLSQLDKIINPYDSIELLNGQIIISSATDIININSCDFDNLEGIISCVDDGNSASLAVIFINGAGVYAQSIFFNATANRANNANQSILLQNLRGKSLRIQAQGNILFHLNKKTKKV
jgi:hypothetical protein